MAEALTAQTEFAFEMTCLHFGNQEVESTFPMRNSGPILFRSWI